MKKLVLLAFALVLTGCGVGGFVVVRSQPAPPPVSMYLNAPAYGYHVAPHVMVRGQQMRWDGRRYVVQTRQQRVEEARTRGYMRGYCARSRDLVCFDQYGRRRQW